MVIITKNTICTLRVKYAVDITLDNTPEFKAVMSHINEVYGEAIHERKKFKYRRPNFIWR